MTDRAVAAVAGVVLVISGAMWTSWVVSGAFDPVRVAEREGEAVLSLYRLDARLDDGSVQVSKGGRQAVLDSLPDDLVPGDELTVTAVPAVDGPWRVTWMERHPDRPMKRTLGIVGLIVTAGLLAVGVRLRAGRLWFRG